MEVHRKKSYKKKQWRPPVSKKKKRGKNTSPRKRKACHNVNTALLQSVAEIDRNPEYHDEQQKDVA
jgi:hypothetical protein